MSRSNYDKPFYVDVGTSVVAIRCASNHDVVDSLDHNGSEHAIKIVERTCDRMNREVELSLGNAAAMREALELCVKQMCANCRDAAHTLAPDTPCVYGCETLKVAKAALAKPPRNCDRLKTFDDFIAAWNSHVTSRKSAEEPIPSVAGFLYWLSQEANEKGESDGR